MMNVEGLDHFDSDDLWLGYAISLDFLETDCFDMDPWVWGESTPTTMLEQTFLGVGFGPMSPEFESVIRPQVSSSGFFWDSDWAPYVFSMTLGLYDQETGELEGTEIDYAFAYKMSDGALTYDYVGDPMPVRLANYEGAPEGLLAGYRYYDEEPSALR